MLKDRGNKKWSSLMLVEHRNGLEKILEHEDDVDLPVLDQQKLEELERILNEAIECNKVVEVTYYESRRHKKITGNVMAGSTDIVFKNKKIPLQNIIDITF